MNSVKDSGSLRAEIELQLSSWLDAFRKGDASKCSEHYTLDASIYSPYSVKAQGRSDVLRTHQAWLDEGETNKTLELLEYSSKGELGYCVLKYSGDYPKPNGTLENESGYSVNVLRRKDDGKWQFHISSLNSEIPPSA